MKEIETNVAALHNTNHKIEQRNKMLNGTRPAECDYCWKIEDLGEDQVSDRFLKSAAGWSVVDFDKVVNLKDSRQHIPRYLEVSFSNTCQFKCSYCSADYSTTWEEELNKFGPYIYGINSKTQVTFKEDENPYIKAFWDWWPQINTSLRTFRITGGEPLLSPNTFKILESLLTVRAPEMSLAINTNLGAPSVLFNRFLNLIDKIELENCVKEFLIFTSIDAFGPRAEYIRHGLKTELFWSNFEKVLSQNKKTNITIMCTFNALSITSFAELFEKVVELNKKYRNELRPRPVLLDIAYLRNPAHQTVKILPESYIEQMQKLVELIEKHNEQLDFLDGPYYNLEYIKIKRLLDWMKEPIDFAYKQQLQRDFYLFFKEHDRRRGTSFLNSFPEMSPFWLLCERMAKTNKIKKMIWLLQRYLSNILIKLKITKNR